MLTKIKGVLQSPAPAEGAEGGTAGTAVPGETSDSAAAENEGAPAENSNNGAVSNDSGDADGTDDDFGSGFDLDEFMRYDPMKAAEELGNPPKEEADDDFEARKAGDDKNQREGKKPEEPAAAKGEKKSGQEEKESPEMKLLREQVNNLTQLLNQQQEQAQKATQQEAPAAKGEKTAEQRHQEIVQSLPQYQFKIPADVMEKFGSEDPAKIQQGLSEFASGIAQVTHYNMLSQIRQEMDALRQELLQESVKEFKNVTSAEQKEAQQRSEISKDFYGKFPELDKPELKLFIQTQAKQLASQYGVNGWNENFRDTLGEHVKKVLGMTNQGPQPGEASGQKKPNPGQRFNSGSGAGRSKPSGKQTEVDDISSTLGI